jgi:hypothetical protein
MLTTEMAIKAAYTLKKKKIKLKKIRSENKKTIKQKTTFQISRK